jgi:hypothetical protein
MDRCTINAAGNCSFYLPLAWCCMRKIKIGRYMKLYTLSPRFILLRSTQVQAFQWADPQSKENDWMFKGFIL